MPNVFDYLTWRGDLTLKQDPFNRADNVILTHLSYLPLDGIVGGPEGKKIISLWETAQIFADTLKADPILERNLMFKEDIAFLESLGSSRRFGGMGLTGFVNQVDREEEKQFAALTILTGDRSVFVSFRGTDNSLVGWKEDFNMIFSDEIPSQAEAVRYLRRTARNFRGSLRVGGHSKGGNLAVYAASFCAKRTQNRISEIYNNDGPGFSDRVLASEGYRAIKEKIIVLVPETSIVGMLFEQDGNPLVVKSSGAGIFQHNVYTWEILGNDLVRLGAVDRSSHFIDRTVKEWMSGLDKQQRRNFTETIFTILGSAEVRSFPELSADWLKSTFVIVQSLAGIDEEARGMMFKTFGALLRIARKNIRALLPLTEKK